MAFPQVSTAHTKIVGGAEHLGRDGEEQSKEKQPEEGRVHNITNFRHALHSVLYGVDVLRRRRLVYLAYIQTLKSQVRFLTCPFSDPFVVEIRSSWMPDLMSMATVCRAPTLLFRTRGTRMPRSGGGELASLAGRKRPKAGYFR